MVNELMVLMDCNKEGFGMGIVTMFPHESIDPTQRSIANLQLHESPHSIPITSIDRDVSTAVENSLSTL